MNDILRFFETLLLSVQGSSVIPIWLRPRLLRLLGVSVAYSAFLNKNITIHKRNIELGELVVIGYGVLLDGTGFLKIGERVHIGPNSLILTGTHEIMPSIYRRDRAQNTNKTTSFARGCWIGSASIVLPGVTIEEGCVIAAGSVVSHNCLANGLYAGVPAKRIRDLAVDYLVPIECGIPIYPLP